MSDQTLLKPVIERALAGEALDGAGRAALFHTADVLTLGMAADELRRRRHGAFVTFVRVADLTVDEALADSLAVAGAPGEIRIHGPADDIPRAHAAVQAVRAIAGGTSVTGFSLEQIETAAGSDRASAVRLLNGLKAAGLDAVADAAIDRLDNAAGMLDAASEAGLPVARLGVDRIAPADRDELLDRVRALVSVRDDLHVFAPLPRRISGAAPSTGYEDVRLVALARLWVPVAHIQVDWSRYGPKLAQVALAFGADDLDAVSPLDDLSEGRRRAPLEEVLRNIRSASSEPRERGALFTPFTR